MNLKLSIIIPTFNEETSLQSLLDDLAKQQQISKEIIIADGGSTDGTLAIAEKYSCRVAKTSLGRGKQFNRAAQLARGKFILFLHADSQLESKSLLKEAIEFLESKMNQRDSIELAGHFGLKFARSKNQNQKSYRYIEEKSFLNRPNTTNGDQGFLLAREFFQNLEGFDETFPFLEDQELAERIRQRGEWLTLPGRLVTSARRFETEGFHRSYILMSIIMGLYSCGFHQFFAGAKKIYSLQEDTHKLFLTPYFNYIWSLINELSLKERFKLWYKVGTYIRIHSWQMFFFFDITLRPLIGKGKYPMTHFHDKIFWPITNNRICNLINTGICYLWFRILLPSYFKMIEYRELSKNKFAWI